MRSIIRLDEKRRLLTLRKLQILDTQPEWQYDYCVSLASFITQCPIAAISLIDEHRQWFKSRVGIDPIETPREIAFCEHTIREPFAMVVEDTLEDPRFATNPLVIGEPYIRFYAGVPLVVHGCHIGTLCVADKEPREMPDSNLHALTVLARLTQSQIEGQFNLAESRLQSVRLLQDFVLAVS